MRPPLAGGLRLAVPASWYVCRPDRSPRFGPCLRSLASPSKRLQTFADPPRDVVQGSGLDKRAHKLGMLCGIAGAKLPVDDVNRFRHVERCCFWSLLNRVIGDLPDVQRLPWFLQSEYVGRPIPRMQGNRCLTTPGQLSSLRVDPDR
jgi:hypothetical protein